MKKEDYVKILIDSSGYTIKSFAKKIDLPYSTLLSMLSRGLSGAAVQNVIKICKELSITVEELHSVETENNNASTIKPSKIEYKKRIPILNEIVDGHPIYTYDKSNDDVDFAVKITGNAMEPELLVGDVVFVKIQNQIDDGQLCAVIIDSIPRVMFYYNRDDKIMLTGCNQKFAPLVYTHEEAKKLNILGIVVACQRNLRK